MAARAPHGTLGVGGASGTTLGSAAGLRCRFLTRWRKQLSNLRADLGTLGDKRAEVLVGVWRAKVKSFSRLWAPGAGYDVYYPLLAETQISDTIWETVKTCQKPQGEAADLGYDLGDSKDLSEAPR
ncbi:hypothetical protein PAL_GLEAN10018378 [Pteropus alecto]|uniref:Uncharacterized protein n=1 Tax=Pteropus alecto TaxID=9402 RepID=L5JQA9_PTEAL|nr:hypothetical protein PAL_GLEAN10018378 [Pteropus alecto]